jgi:hypothetical protein
MEPLRVSTRSLGVLALEGVYTGLLDELVPERVIIKVMKEKD